MPEQWGRYDGDPPASDAWYFRSNEIQLITRALGAYVAQIDGNAVYAEEREHAMLVWRRLMGTPDA